MFALPGAGRVIDGSGRGCCRCGRHIDRGVMASSLERRKSDVGRSARREEPPTRPVNHRQLLGRIVAVRTGLAERRDRQHDKPWPCSNGQLGIQFGPRTVVYHQVSVGNQCIDRVAGPIPDRPFVGSEPPV